MVPLYDEGAAMPCDGNDSDALADIEAGLAKSDPRFRRRMAATQTLLPRPPPTWGALASSGVRLVITAAFLVAAVRLSQPLLLVPAVLLFAVTLRPINRSVREQAAVRGRASPQDGAVSIRPSRWPRIPRGTAPSDTGRVIPVNARHAVVVGCDGTPASNGALRFAAKESLLRSANLIVLATYHKPIDPDNDEFDTPDHVLAERARKAALTAMCRALDLTRPVLPPHDIVTQCGVPARVLLDMFSDADLIVLGTHQRHLVSRLFHGPSTSSDLIHHGHFPVVVVPPDWDRGDDPPAPA
jgi:nucleotide-binding universal stress UspA family protein